MRKNWKWLYLTLAAYALSSLGAAISPPAVSAQDWAANGNNGYPSQPQPPAQAYPQTQNPGQRPAAATPQQQAKVGQWFAAYDQIRRTAQMNPQEKAYSDQLLSKTLSVFIPGPEKLAAQQLLGRMVTRYDKACTSLKTLPSTPETLQLQKGYFQYFATARGLFADYLRVQQNVLAVDNQGNSLAAGLMPRKQMLENLEMGVKQLDGQLRSQFGVQPYHY